MTERTKEQLNKELQKMNFVNQYIVWCKTLTENEKKLEAELCEEV